MATFYTHYFKNDVFPWDFQFTYYYFRYYAITSLQAGVFPEWLPFQSAGYAFPVNPQSSLSYPADWLFVLANKPFTLHAASLLQCLHILGAGLGAFLLALLLGFPMLASLCFGCAFHFYSIFFSNAQHVDIVIANALIPWVIVGIIAANSKDRRVRTAGVVALPLICYCFLTGGYIGAVISTFFVIGLSFAYRFIKAIISRESLSVIFRPGLLLVLGGLLAAHYLMPIILLKSQFIRSDDYSSHTKNWAEFRHVFTFFMPYVYYPFHLPTKFLNNDVSDRNLFITLPLFFSLFLLSFRVLRKRVPLLLLVCLSSLLICDNPIVRLLGKIFPVLALSRFPITDYRVLLSLPLGLIGMHSLRDFFENRQTWLWFCTRSAGILSFFYFGLQALVWRESIRTEIFTTTFFGSFALFLALLLAKQARLILNPTILWALFCTLVCFDGLQYHYNQRVTWSVEPNASLVWETLEGGRYTRNYPAWHKDLQAAITQTIKVRPPRTDTYPYLLGYRQGIYSLDDYAGGARFVSNDRALHSTRLKNFLALPGGASEISEAEASQTMDQPIDEMKLSPLIPTNGVTSTSYRPTSVAYDVNLDHDSIVMENEINFPGWSAEIHDPHSKMSKNLTPITNLPLRAWRLPAGKYQLLVGFQLPWLRSGIAISAICLIGILGLWGWIGYRFVRTQRKPI